MTIEERLHRAVAERADTPEAHKRGLPAKGPQDRIEGSGRGGLLGQTRGCPGVIGRPRFPQTTRSSLPVAYHVCLSLCGTTTGE